MGRIHRYGQQLEVHIWNMITRDTREGQILDRLFEKLERMKEALGSDRVFDIIGDMIPGSRLDELLKDAIFNQRRMEEIEQHIDALDVEQAGRTLEKAFMTSLATRHIDYSGILKQKVHAEENRLMPEYVQDFFLRAYRRVGGTIQRRKDSPHAAPIPSPNPSAALRAGLGGRGQEGYFYAIDRVPFELRQWNDDYGFKTTYGEVFRSYKQLTFDKQLAYEHPQAEFVAPSHPLLEALNEEILKRFEGHRERYALFGDPEREREGALCFIEGEITDGSGQIVAKRVFCLYHGLDGTFQRLNPGVLWDYDALDKVEPPAHLLTLLQQEEIIEEYIVTELLFPFQEEMSQQREHETHIKEKYGLRSLDYLIQQSNEKLLDYEFRKEMGQQMELPIRNEERNLEQLRLRRDNLAEELTLEANLTVNDPIILGTALVMPLPERQTQASSKTISQVREGEIEYNSHATQDAARKKEIELVGMRIAMQYETEAGWHAQDVSPENHGFDIRSTLYDEEGIYRASRYIEVKARARSGAIRLSANEWKKARRHRNQYWLYIVTHAATDTPQLTRIQNPAANFTLGQEIFATGFIIPEEKWRGRACVSGRFVNH